MKQITQQEEEHILEVVNLLGPGLQQAISNAIVDAEMRLRQIHDHPDHVPTDPDIPKLLWCQVYSEYIGANVNSGQLDYDPAMLHDNAAFHAEMAFNAFNKRFPNE